jgi:hypothetical protein
VKWKVMVLVVGIVLAMTLLVGTAAAGTTCVNQGNPDMVLTANNCWVSCCSPMPGPKIEGCFGRCILVTSRCPIDFVTLKSGKDAEVVWKQFGRWCNGTYWAKVCLSKDVSNYVVWTCPCCPCCPD